MCAVWCGVAWREQKPATTRRFEERFGPQTVGIFAASTTRLFSERVSSHEVHARSPPAVTLNVLQGTLPDEGFCLQTPKISSRRCFSLVHSHQMTSSSLIRFRYRYGDGGGQPSLWVKRKRGSSASPAAKRIVVIYSPRIPIFWLFIISYGRPPPGCPSSAAPPQPLDPSAVPTPSC